MILWLVTMWWWPSSSYDDHHHVSWPPLTQVSAGGSINMTSLDSVNNIRGGMWIQGIFFLGSTWSTVIVFIWVNWWRNFMNFNCYNLYNLYFVLLKINLVLFIKILRFFLRMNSFCKSLTFLSLNWTSHWTIIVWLLSAVCELFIGVTTRNGAASVMKSDFNGRLPSNAWNYTLLVSTL